MIKWILNTLNIAIFDGICWLKLHTYGGAVRAVHLYNRIVIQIENLQKVQDGRTVLAVETLGVAAGEICAVVGPAGSGKELLLAVLTGREHPTLGQVRIDGRDPAADQAAFSRQVGVMFAVDALYARQSVRDNLQFHARLRGLPNAQVQAVLERVGLADQARVRVDKLPSGLKRRLSFGIAALHDPTVLLLESPFAGCDEASLELLRRLIRAAAEAGSAVLILAENEAHLHGLCERIARLDQGRVVEVYEPGSAAAEEGRVPFKIPVRLEGSVALVNPADISYIEIEEGRTYLQTADARLPSQYTLAELEERLAGRGFFRAHRGYLVNLQHVLEVIPFTRDSYSLRIDDEAGTLIPLSKSAAAELRELLGF
jgi:ABC-2 type transport system ATP-binding protein